MSSLRSSSAKKIRPVTTTVALLGASAVALTGCGATGGGAGQDSDAPVVVSMWASDEAETAAFERQIAIAKEQNPDIKIEARTSPWADYFTKLTTDMASGNTACVVGMNSSMFDGYVSGLRPLSDEDLKTAGLDTADFAPGSTEIMAVDGDIYALPTDISTMLTYTNKDLLKAAGATVPADGWSFDEFRSTAETATRDGKYGFAVGLSSNSWMAIPISVTGVQPVTEAGELDLTNSKFVDAATRFAELVTVDEFSPEFPSAAEKNFAQDQYVAGNIGMVIDGSWQARRYLESDSGFEAGIAPLPGDAQGKSTGMALGSGWGVSESCENPDAALKVLGSLLSKQTIDEIAEAGRSYPARIESQPLYIDSLPEGIRDEVAGAFEVAFANVEGQRVTADWAKVGAFITPNLIDVYSGRVPMEQMLDQAQSQFGK